MVLLSLSPVGLKRLLRVLACNCIEDQLVINHSKSKVIVFSRKRRKYRWQVNGTSINQVPSYRYLGILFHKSGLWRSQVESARAIALRSSKALLSFFCSKGGHYVPSAIRVFTAKVISKLLYGAQVSNYNSHLPFEIIQTKFLRSILAVPPCISNAKLRYITGMPSIESQIWILKFRYWMKLIFEPVGLSPLILIDNFQSKWKKSLSLQLTSLGFSIPYVISLGRSKALLAITQRILDVDFQNVLSCLGPRFASSPSLKPFTSAQFLYHLSIPRLRKAFTMAKFDVLPSALLEGRFNRIPQTESYCPCDSGAIETAGHVLLECRFYTSLRSHFIIPLFQKFPSRDKKFFAQYLLADINSPITCKVMNFFAAAIDTRRDLMSKEPLT
ncbi:uncharacterized protein LOC133367087 [Rhineura floridana]|uniref:uncharacterized protein LOC133367087 n=1 Tax=Rhineura floridana TaxID=261503 RepID=UPI002AC86BCA|nr:uncharacterized protein LOC133367087 [Rhineura floridana]XP_061446803.1 uncharacterized protein LOC133367087 [Rhineura floridana]